ncbi:MAG: hypothetical protein IEMM0008_0310 [bacterium]|nr:MAG: hypothetical protein IEMM0008_0310 [bacterium]
MDHPSHIKKDLVDYYQNLLDPEKEDDSSVFGEIADKLLESMDVQVLDFENSAHKEVSIGQVRHLKTILILAKPLTIHIEKLSDGFIIYQKELTLSVYSKTFQESIKKFQKHFIRRYHYYCRLNVKSQKDIHLKSLFTALVK